MSYFGFLARFVLIPLAGLTFLLWRGSRKGQRLPDALRGVPPLAALGGLVTVAVAYTTPWDNYLVASKVWWYDKKLVNGLILGYVPIEEYSFFVLQTLLTGAWVLWLARHVPHDPRAPKNPTLYRLGMSAALGAVWIGAVWNLIRGRQSRTYLSLVLSWALLPIIVQVAFGGDILWQHRRLVALGIIPSTIYLAVSDSLAIDSGTWTINPEKTVNVLLGGKLPLEEGLFFLLTNTLVSVGLTLVMAKDSQKRVPPRLLRWLGIMR
ncbi:MAG: lycopene cyclase domain-containing protein [Chloroflexota bacterium]|nr:lycopene cyclase domain-containing protein [Chloroflexota bacterium]